MKKTLFEGKCDVCGEEAIITKYKVCLDCSEEVSKEYGKQCAMGRKVTIKETAEMLAVMNTLTKGWD